MSILERVHEPQELHLSLVVSTMTKPHLGNSWFARIARFEFSMMKDVAKAPLPLFLIKNFVARPSHLAQWSHTLPDTENCPICFVIIIENHLDHFKPIAEKLRSKGIKHVLLFTNLKTFLEHRDEFPQAFPANLFFDQVSYWKSCVFQARLWCRKKKFAKSNGLTPTQASIAIIRCAKPAFLLYRLFQKQASRFSKVVLFKAEGFQAEAILSACKAQSAATFAIQHGLVNVAWQFANLQVDRYLVWSDFFKQRLLASHAGCEISIVGNPAYDTLFQRLQKNGITATYPPHLARLLVLPNSGMSHTPLSDVHELLDSVLHLAEKQPKVQVSIKPHPSDVMGNVSRYLLPRLAKYPNVILLSPSEIPAYESATVVCINNSAAGLEACIWRKPLLVFAPNWEQGMVKQYMEGGVAEFADCGDTFVRAFDHIHRNYAKYQARCRRFLDEQLAFQGKAVDRILEELGC